MAKAQYQVITNAITEQIRSGRFKSGDRIPSVSELCNTYSVSQITALRVFKELTSGNYISKKEGRGYYVKGRSERGKESLTGAIGCLLRPIRRWQPEDNYFNEINCAVQAEAGKRRMNLFWTYTCSPLNEHFVPPRHLQMEMMRAALDIADKVDGYLIDERISDEVISDILKKTGKPAVLVNRRSELPIDTVTGADVEGASKMAEAAIKFGYEYFIICSGGDGNLNMRSSSFIKALDEQCLNKDNVVLLNKCHINPLEISLDSLNNMVDNGLKDKMKIFIFSNTDYFARTTCDFALEKGLVPGKDIGVAGFGGFGVTTSEKPELATVDINSSGIGSMAIDKLLFKVANPFAKSEDHSPEFELRFGETM